MSQIQPLEIPIKEDYPESVLATQNIPAKYKRPAEEYNKSTAKINELVAAVNKKVTTLADATDDTHPSTKAVADEMIKRKLLATDAEYVCADVSEVNNLNTAGKACIIITNPISITGIKTDGFTDGQMIIIKNASNNIVNVQHESNQSLAANRFRTSTGQMLAIRANTWLYFRFSKVRQRIELFNVFGTDLLLSLTNNGNEARVVLVQPDGTVTSENIMEYEVHDEAVLPYNNLQAIVNAYPTQVNGVDVRKKGFQVICAFSNPPAIYKKCGDGNEHWLKISNGTLTKLT